MGGDEGYNGDYSGSSGSDGSIEWTPYGPLHIPHVLGSPNHGPYHVYNLQDNSHDFPALLKEVVDRSDYEWLYSQDVINLFSSPADLTLTTHSVQFHTRGLFLFEKWMNPDNYNWDFVSTMQLTNESDPMCYTFAKMAIGPFGPHGLRSRLWRRIYEPNCAWRQQYMVVHYRYYHHGLLDPSSEDSGQSVTLLDPYTSDEDTSDEDFVADGSSEGEQEALVVHSAFEEG